MLSRTRAFFRGLLLNGRKVAQLLREMAELRMELEIVRQEWETELAEMRGMWDKLQLWAARQAKRDKALTTSVVDQLVDGSPPQGSTTDPRQMTKDQLRKYFADQKRGVLPIRSEAE